MPGRGRSSIGDSHIGRGSLAGLGALLLLGEEVEVVGRHWKAVEVAGGLAPRAGLQERAKYA